MFLAFRIRERPCGSDGSRSPAGGLVFFLPGDWTGDLGGPGRGGVAWISCPQVTPTDARQLSLRLDRVIARRFCLDPVLLRPQLTVPKRAQLVAAFRSGYTPAPADVLQIPRAALFSSLRDLADPTDPVAVEADVLAHRFNEDQRWTEDDYAALAARRATYYGDPTSHRFLPGLKPFDLVESRWSLDLPAIRARPPRVEDERTTVQVLLRAEERVNHGGRVARVGQVIDIVPEDHVFTDAEHRRCTVLLVSGVTKRRAQIMLGERDGDNHPRRRVRRSALRERLPVQDRREFDKATASGDRQAAPITVTIEDFRQSLVRTLDDTPDVPEVPA